MAAGDLRKRLTLQRESLSSGGQTGIWTTVATVWGSIAPSTRYYDYLNSERRVTHIIRVRYRSDVTVATGMRFVCGSRVFTVRYVVIDGEKNRWLDVLVEEGGGLE